MRRNFALAKRPVVLHFSVGVDIKSFANEVVDRDAKRKELGIEDKVAFLRLEL